MLEQATSPTPSLVPDRYGSYLVEQKVTHGGQQSVDYAQVLVLDWDPDIWFDTFLPDMTAYGGPDQRTTLGQPVTLDARRSGIGLPMQQRYMYWSLPTALGGELFEGPVATVISQQRGGHQARHDFYNFRTRRQEYALSNVFVDTPFWTQRPLLFADEAGRNIRPTDVAVTDFSGDGNPDLVVSRWVPSFAGGRPSHAGAMLTVYPLQPGGSLGQPRHFTVPFAGAMAVADINGDGRKDLVLRGDQKIALFFQQSGGQLQPGPAFELGPCRWIPPDRGGLVHVGDVTGNGRADIVAAGGCEPDYTLVTLAQREGGAFDVVHTPTGPGAAASLVAGDLSGDGRMDIAMSGAFIGAGLLRIGFARTDGGFDFEDHPLPGLSSSGYPVIGDLNGDGRLDVAILADHSLYVFLQRPAGGFERQTAGNLQVDPNEGLSDLRLFAGDIDGDGRTDLLVLGWSGHPGHQAFAMMQDRQGRFGQPRLMPLFSREPGYGTRILIMDLDGDGKAAFIAARANPGIGPGTPHSGTLEIVMQRP